MGRRAASSLGPVWLTRSSEMRELVMGQVTIEGTVTPSVELARGERRTVEYTEHVGRLVRLGAVRIVDRPAPAPAPAAVPASEPLETVALEPDPSVDEHGDGPDGDGVPAKNASTKVWRAWVADNVPGVTADDVADKGRDQLVAAWERYTQQVSGGS